MQFGQPSRTAAQDANEGIVDIPSVREQVKGQGIRAHQAQDKTGKSTAEVFLPVLDEGVRRFQQYADKAVEDKNEDLRIQGAIAQGENRAIVDIEGVEKRTGLSEYLFGQNAKYEGAQRQAVRNNIREWGTAAKKELASHVGKSPEEYRNTINAQFNEHIKTFEGDPETQALLRKEYSVQAERLMDGYTKERYIHTQNESRKEASRTIGNAFDDAIVDAENVVPGTSDFDRVYDAYRSAFDYDTFMANNPDVSGITPANYQEIVVENLIESINKDNKQAYQAAQQLGFTDQIDDRLRGQLEAAEAKRVERSDMQSVYAQAHFNAEVDNANTWDAYQSLRDTFADNNNADPKRWPAKDWLAYEAKIRHNINRKELSDSKVRKAVSKQLSPEEKVQAAVELKGHGLSAAPTSKERDAAKNVLMLERIGGSTLSPDSVDKTTEELADDLFQDPAKITLAAQRLQSANLISPAEVHMMKAVVDNLDYTGGEDFMSEAHYNRVSSLLTYEDRTPNVLRKVLGDEGYAKLEFFHKQTRKGINLKDITADWERRKEQASVEADWGTYKDIKGKTKNHNKQSAIRQLLRERTKSFTVTDAEIDRFSTVYDRWLSITQDHSAALQAARSEMNNYDSVIMGQNVPNGREIDDNLQDYRSNNKVLLRDQEAVQLAVKTDADAQIEHYHASTEELLDFAQQRGMLDVAFRSLGITPDPNTNEYLDRQMQSTSIDMTVPYGTSVLRIEARTVDGNRVYDLDTDFLRMVQDEYTLANWKVDQYALIEKDKRDRYMLETHSRGHIKYDEYGEQIRIQ